MRREIARDQSGFTLPEVLVAMVMMLTVMFALYSIFDMSLRVFSFGNNKVEAVENARLGVSKMEREIRAAYPENKASGSDTLLFSNTNSDTIIFRNDLDGDREAEPSEEIEYYVSADGEKLLRKEGSGNGSGEAAVENLDSMSFDYQDTQGGPANPEDAEIVEINLTVKVDKGTPNEGTQTISTDVSLRNRAN